MPNKKKIINIDTYYNFLFKWNTIFVKRALNPLVQAKYHKIYQKKKYERYDAYQPEFHVKKIYTTQILLYNECQ